MSTNANNRNRTPAGVPTGGQFATGRRTETDTTTLGGAAQPPADPKARAILEALDEHSFHTTVPRAINAAGWNREDVLTRLPAEPMRQSAADRLLGVTHSVRRIRNTDSMLGVKDEVDEVRGLLEANGRLTPDEYERLHPALGHVREHNAVASLIASGHDDPEYTARYACAIGVSPEDPVKPRVL